MTKHDEWLVEAVAREIDSAHAWQALDPQDLRRLACAALDAADRRPRPELLAAVCAALDAADRARQPCPELLAAVRHVDAIANSAIRPTKEDCQMSHSLLVDLVLALHPPRVDLGFGQPPSPDAGA